jgi:hypothetical protein
MRSNSRPSLTATGGVGEQQGAARVRDGCYLPRHPWRTGDPGRRQSGPSRSPGSPGRGWAGRPRGVPGAGGPARPSQESRGSVRLAGRVIPPSKSRSAGPQCQSSNAFIPTGPGVGRPALGRSPSVPVLVLAATEARYARGGGVLGGDEAPLPPGSRAWSDWQSVGALVGPFRSSDDSGTSYGDRKAA